MRDWGVRCRARRGGKARWLGLALAVAAISGCGFLESPRPARWIENRAVFEPARWLHGTTGHFTTDLLIHHGALVAAWLVPARASTYTIAVFRSTDGGLTWTGAPLDLPDYTFYGVDGMDWPFSLASDSRGHLFMAYASLEKGIALARLDEVGRVQATFDITADQRPFTYFRNPFLLIGRDGNMVLFYTKRTLEPQTRSGPQGTEGVRAAVHWQRGVERGQIWRESVPLQGTDGRGYSVCRPVGALDHEVIFYLHCGTGLFRHRNGGWQRVHGRLGASEGIGQSQLQIDHGGNLYLAWVRKHVTKSEFGIDGSGSEEGFTQICFARSPRGGTRWSWPVRVNDTPLPFKWKSAPFYVQGREYYTEYALQATKKAVLLDFAVGENGSTLSILWRDWRTGAPHLYLSYSLDGGVTWSRNVRVDEGVSEIPTDASLATSGNNAVYVLWLARASDERQFGRDVRFVSGSIVRPDR